MQGESAGVPKVPLDRQVLGVSLAAVYLQSFVGDVYGHLRREELGLKGQNRQWGWPSVPGLCRLVQQTTGCLYLRAHLTDEELNPLISAEGLPGHFSGFGVLSMRAPRLVETLQQSRGDGSHLKALARLSRVQLLIIDDFLLTPLTDWEQRDLLEVIEDRYQLGATSIASQCPIGDWHPNIGDPTLADAICDRLLHNAYRIELRGDSMRTRSPAANRKNERKEAVVNDGKLS